MRKTTNLGIWTHFGEVRSYARPWLMARRKAHGRLSICVNWTFFRSYEAKYVQLDCFRRGRPLCTEILSGHGGLPSTSLGIVKLETMGYPMIKTASLCVFSFCHITGLWRADGRTDLPFCRSIYINSFITPTDSRHSTHNQYNNTENLQKHKIKKKQDKTHYNL